MRTPGAIGLCLALLFVGGCTSDDSDPDPRPGPVGTGVFLEVTPAEAQFAAGQAVVLRVRLTNTEPSECRVTKVTAGTLSIVSLARDGEVVTPGLGEGTYIDGTASFLRQNLQPLGAGRSITMDLVSAPEPAMDGRSVLETSAAGPLDSAALTYWPVSVPGRYTLLARYTPPPLQDPPGRLCHASGDPAKVEFTVAGA